MDFSYWSKSCPELSNQVLSFSEVWSSCATTRFQLFDIWWSSLDKINDFKAISRLVFFRFGEIINIMMLSFVKKFFLTFFLILYKISIYKKNIWKKKMLFFQKKTLKISLKKRNFFFWNISFIHRNFITTVFPRIVSAETILFLKLDCDHYSREETIQGRKAFFYSNFCIQFYFSPLNNSLKYYYITDLFRSCIPNFA